MKNTRLRILFFAIDRKNKKTFRGGRISPSRSPASTRPILARSRNPGSEESATDYPHPTFAWLMAWWHVINREAQIIDTFVFDLPRPSTIKSINEFYQNFGSVGNDSPLEPIYQVIPGVDLTGIMHRRALGEDLDADLRVLDTQIEYYYSATIMQLKLKNIGRLAVDPVINSANLEPIYDRAVAPNTPFFSGVDLDSAGLSLEILNEPRDAQPGIARISASKTPSPRLNQAAEDHTPLTGLYVRRHAEGDLAVELNLAPKNKPGHTNITYYNLVHSNYAAEPLTQAVRVRAGDHGPILSLNNVKKPSHEFRYSINQFTNRYQNARIQYHAVRTAAGRTRNDLTSISGVTCTATLLSSPFHTFTVVGRTTSLLDGGELARAVSILRGVDAAPIKSRMPTGLYVTTYSQNEAVWL